MGCEEPLGQGHLRFLTSCSSSWMRLLSCRTLVFAPSRMELLEPIQHQLQALLSVIRSQSSYRFYSSSLLIIYDGQETPQTPHGSSVFKVDVRMIDFAHTTYKGSWNEHTTYDG